MGSCFLKKERKEEKMEFLNDFMIPVIIAALSVLGIEAISAPAIAMLHTMFGDMFYPLQK